MSAASHLLGAAVFTVVGVHLVRRGWGDKGRILSLAVMSVCTVLLLTVSGLYHISWPGPVRDGLLRADISGIFLVFAGSLTPVHAILLRGVRRWLPLTIFWTAATSGIVLRMLYFEQLSGPIGVIIFMALGWCSCSSATMLWFRYGWNFIQNGIGAGMCYTVGAILLMLHQPILVPGLIGPHEVWHLIVLAGLSFHYSFVFQFAHGIDEIEVEAEDVITLPIGDFELQPLRRAA